MVGRASGSDEVESALLEDPLQQVGRHEVLPQAVGFTGAVVVRGPRQSQPQALGQEANLLALLGAVVAMVHLQGRQAGLGHLGEGLIGHEAALA